MKTRHTHSSLRKVPIQLVASLAAEGSLARCAQESMVTDGSGPLTADTQQEHRIPKLPDKFAALQQHHLKLQLVQVVNQTPPAKTALPSSPLPLPARKHQ